MDEEETTTKKRPPWASPEPFDTIDEAGGAQEVADGDLVDGDLVRELSVLSTGEETPTARRLAGLPPPARQRVETPAWTEVAEPVRPAADPLAALPWEYLIQELRTEAEIAAPERAAVLMHDIGRIFETHLEKPMEALTCYRESHRRAPLLGINTRALTRQLARVGDHQAELAVLDTALAAASTTSQRVEALVDRAQLKLRALADPEGALKDLRQAAELDPSSFVLELLEEAARRLSDAAAVIGLWRARADACGDPALASAMLFEAGRVCEEQLRDLPRARTIYREARERCPANALALRGLLRLARAQEDFSEVALLCEALADLERGHAAAAYLDEAARIRAHRLRDLDGAAERLQRACTLTPDSAAVWLELAELQEQTQRWPALAATLERAAHLVTDPAEVAETLCWLARVRLGPLGDAEAAVKALREAIEVAPQHVPARRMLGQICSELGRHEDLLELLRRELTLFQEPKRQASICYRMGHVLETRVGDLSRAAAAFRWAFQFVPGYRPAVAALGRVLPAQGRWEELAQVLEESLVTLDDPTERARILAQIAEIAENRLQQSTLARPAYERLLAVDPSHLGATQALRRIYEEEQSFDALAKLLRTEAAQTEEQPRATALLIQLADLQERRCGDARASLETWLEVLARAPTCLPALDAALRLSEAVGDHAQALQLLRRELERSGDDRQQAWLLVHIARVMEQGIGAWEEAAVCYVEAMARSAEPQIGVDQIIRLAQREPGRVALAQLLLRLPTPDARLAQSLHHRRIAETLGDHQPPAFTDERLRRALAASDDDAALQMILRLHHQAGDTQRLADFYRLAVQRSHDPIERAVAQLKLAYLWMQNDRDLDRAVEVLHELRAALPESQPVLRQLRWCLCRLGRWEEVARVVALCSDACSDPAFRTACALEASTLLDDRLDDVAGAAVPAYGLLEGDAFPAEALDIVERHCRTKGDPSGLASVLRLRIAAAQSGSERAALLFALGSLHIKAGQLDQAAEVMGKAASLRPPYLPALEAAVWLARRAGEHEQAAHLLAAEAQASLDPGNRARCLFEAARIVQQQIGDEDRAAAAYERVLDVDPRHMQAIEALQASYTTREKHAELARLLDHAARHVPDPETRCRWLVRRAQLLHESLGDRQAATAVLDEITALQPADPDVRSKLAALCRALGVRRTQTGDHRRVEVAQVQRAAPGTLDYEPATESDVAVLELGPDDPASLERLSNWLVEEGQWTAAARATEDLLGQGHDRERRKQYLVRLAKIRAEGLGDAPGALDAYRSALALDPGDLAITEQMSRLQQGGGDPSLRDAQLQTGLAVHRAQLDRDPFHLPSYVALRESFERQNLTTRGLVVRTLLVAIGAGTDEDKALVEGRRESVRGASPPPLTAEVIHRLIHPDAKLVRQVLLAAEEEVRSVLKPPKARGSGARRFSDRSHPALSATLKELAAGLGGVEHRALLARELPELIAVEDSTPPAVYIDRSFEELEAEEIRFRLAGALAHVRLRHSLAARLGAADLGEVMAALLAAAHPTGSSPAAPTALGAEIQAALTPTARQALQAAARDPGEVPLDPQRWLRAMALSEDRVALVLGGDLQAATRVIRRLEGQAPAAVESPEQLAEVAGPRLRHLLGFAVSEEYLSLCELRDGSARA